MPLTDGDTAKVKEAMGLIGDFMACWSDGDFDPGPSFLADTLYRLLVHDLRWYSGSDGPAAKCYEEARALFAWHHARVADAKKPAKKKSERKPTADQTFAVLRVDSALIESRHRSLGEAKRKAQRLAKREGIAVRVVRFDDECTISEVVARFDGGAA